MSLWDSIIDQHQIKEHILAYNQDAFWAAATSFCGKTAVHDALTFSAFSPEAGKLLQVMIPTRWHKNNDLLYSFLASFQISHSVLDSDPIDTNLEAKDNWEATSTSPSGRHLGHCKALIQDKQILQCLRKFLTYITLSRGIAIPRWSKAVNIMLEKDKGNSKINRLQIQPFDADYNLILNNLGI
jgi:hypothetical protein